MKPHEILGLDPWASDEDLKRRFHELAQQHHPDKGGDPERFKEINAAYRDMLATFRPPRPEPAPEPGSRPEPMYPNDENLIVATVTATIAEIKAGKTIPLTYYRSFRCMVCKGSVQPNMPSCRACMGKGYFAKVQHMDAVLKEK